MTPTPGPGSPARPSYDELDEPARRRDDCVATGANLHLDRIARAAAAGPPSLEYDDQPRGARKRRIEVGEAAARIANALHLHLD